MASVLTGTRVRFSANFLRSTGQYAGPDAPTHVGPFARGTVTAVEPFPGQRYVLVRVRWDDGHDAPAALCNLEPC